ncbi:uncharacterized protein TNCV_4361381 [Trichonephila clavipes]|nr:uncharacterized protein TNCV_4361381 [Trichonephila clavipes]
MAASSFVPTDLGREDNVEEEHPQMGTLQWRPTRFNLPNPEVHKKLGLSMLDHIFVPLETQVQDYVEVRNPKTMAQLLEIMTKFEERYSCKEMRGLRNSDNVGRRGSDERSMSNDDSRRKNWRDAEEINRPSDRRNNYRDNYQNGPQGNERNLGSEKRNRGNTDNPIFLLLLEYISL